MGFVHLHGHSQYSLLEGIGSVPNIIAQAQQLGMSAIAITDYYSMYGALEFYQKAKKADLQAIIGVEMPLVHDINIKSGAFEHLGFVTILCNNRDGYHDLLKLVSYANTTGYYHKPRVDRALLSKYHANLTVLVGGEQGVIGSMITKDLDDQTISDMIGRLSDTMHGQLIIEYCVQDYNLVPLAHQINDQVIRLHQQSDYIITCSNNYHYIHADDQQPWEVALAIKDQKLYSDRDRRKVVGHYHIMTEAEIRLVIAGHSTEHDLVELMITNTSVCAEKLRITMPPLPAMFPLYDPPEHITLLYESHKDLLVVQ